MRTILISGANRGIGRAIAERAICDGHRISLGLRDIDSIKNSSLDPEITGRNRVITSRYEARDPRTSKQWVQEALNEFGDIDTVINCAGIFKSTPLCFSDKDQQELDELWRINVMGPWNLTKEAWPHISKGGNGRVIVLVSMSGKRSKGSLAGYAVSKFALMGLCQTMRNIGWAKGIRVTAICPGWVNTDMASKIDILPKESMTQPEDIASITSNLLILPNQAVPFEVGINCILET